MLGFPVTRPIVSIRMANSTLWLLQLIVKRICHNVAAGQTLVQSLGRHESNETGEKMMQGTDFSSSQMAVISNAKVFGMMPWG